VVRQDIKFSETMAQKRTRPMRSRLAVGSVIPGHSAISAMDKPSASYSMIVGAVVKCCG
jgi:hypothetical protein